MIGKIHPSVLFLMEKIKVNCLELKEQSPTRNDHFDIGAPITMVMINNGSRNQEK